MNLTRIFDLARKVSMKSDHHTFSLGAVLFRGKQVLSVGHNHLFKTHPEYSKINSLKTLHAEASCVLACRHKHNLKGATIVVYRGDSNGEFALAKPCNDCMTLLKKYGITRIIYSTHLGWNEENIE